jgi:hypothetical protein
MKLVNNNTLDSTRFSPPCSITTSDLPPYIRINKVAISALNTVKTFDKHPKRMPE